ncbi:putative transporter [Acetobacteroides hydrogenigenes]|uniref:AspT/YidE/YbjL antiporter-like protein n=1 Tax=Acetobacteroides hydrogenigenes TaxID=979970 RepID=A0A4R2EYT3_9BACT|nr:putative transporter [Acetobacteroides hydrogenigenes]TCN73107.1 AspT/YidE/YbjL antiporter-like protein [Acetobacteroides hydrogenigenes]
MEWFGNLFVGQSVIQAVVLLSTIIAVGLSLGQIKVLGVSLGVTFVFFVGILAGHWGFSIEPTILSYAESFGLILFVYALGLQVGPSFFASFLKGGVRLNTLALGVVLVGTLMMLVFHFSTSISLPEMTGIFCGAVTNTPALGAAQQTIKQLSADPTLQSDLALGCAVTYPLGVVGVIIGLVVLRNLSSSAKKEEQNEEGLSRGETFIASFYISNPAIYGKSVEEVASIITKKFVISRVWHGDNVIIPNSETILEKGDKILVITDPNELKALTALFGQEVAYDWNKSDIDWNAIDSQLVSQRIVITQSDINGKKIAQLKLRNRFGVNITRIHRSGIDLLATPDLTLQVGDKVTVVGTQSSIKQLEALLGNRVKSLHEPNLVAIFIGIVLGLILGSIPISIPWVSLPIKLGLAGGPIVVGILMGAFGPRFHIVTYTTKSANLMLRGVGISLYLACLGLDAGKHFFETVFRTEGLVWLGIGFVLTVLPVLIVGAYALMIKKMDYPTVSGMLCGSMANPMALNYANTTVESDMPSVSYATVYPLCMFVRVIIAQLILIVFM